MPPLDARLAAFDALPADTQAVLLLCCALGDTRLALVLAPVLAPVPAPAPALLPGWPGALLALQQDGWLEGAGAPPVSEEVRAVALARWRSLPPALSAALGARVLQAGIAACKRTLDSGMERRATPQGLAPLRFLVEAQAAEGREAAVWEALALDVEDLPLLRAAAEDPTLPLTLRGWCVQQVVRRAVLSGGRHDPTAALAWARGLLPDDAPLPWAQSLVNAALYHSWHNDLPTALSLSQEALHRTEGDSGAGRILALWMHAHLLCGAGRLEESAPWELAGLDLARARGRTYLELAILNVQSGRLLELQRWSEARTHLQVAYTLSEGWGVRRVEVLLSQALLALLSHPEAAPDAFAAALDALQGTPWSARAPVVQLQQSMALSRVGRLDDAAAALAAACQGLPHEDPSTGWLGVSGGLLHAQRAGQWSEAGRRALHDLPVSSTVGRAVKRWLADQAGLALPRARPDGSRVVFLDGTVLDLSARPVFRRLINALAASAQPLPRDALIAAGWPDERIHPEAARNRLDVTLSALRKMGLRGALAVEGERYALHGLLLDACC